MRRGVNSRRWLLFPPKTFPVLQEILSIGKFQLVLVLQTNIFENFSLKQTMATQLSQQVDVNRACGSFFSQKPCDRHTTCITITQSLPSTADGGSQERVSGRQLIMQAY